MKKKLKMEFNFQIVPFIGIGIGTQSTIDSKDLLIFLPFITIEITFKIKRNGI